ncbi:MAG: methionyl-tRNA formyltransferase [Candidatus Improbicoccus devescovinae]|nr:MAG: methionyl-tRNA formyltransferase [Candidatus Improbicoccus devescovinae]
MGTPGFAVASLASLINSNFDIELVVTQPDKFFGRNKQIHAPEVKIFGEKYGLKIFQPDSLKNPEVYECFKKINPDFIIVAAYGKILPEAILNTAKIACINVHGSLLPKWRGPAPVQYSILNGDEKTGVTIMLMDSGLDTGDILSQEEILINHDDTTGSLMVKIANLGAKLLVETLVKIQKKEDLDNFRIKQDDYLATFTKIVKKENAKINWWESSKVIHNLVRSMNPWPIAFTQLSCIIDFRYLGEHDSILKIYNTKLLNSNKKYDSPGTIVNTNPVIVTCRYGELELLDVQVASRKRMSAVDCIRGYKIQIY